jgi:hypothetical protein
MPQIFFPYTPKEIRKTCVTFFLMMKNDVRALIVRNSLPQHDFDALAEERFAKWLELDDFINEMEKLVQYKREERDNIWNDNLRTPVMAAKNIITVLYPKSPMIWSLFGFLVKNIIKKGIPTQESVDKDLRRIEANVNAMNEAKAIKEAVKEAKANAIANKSNTSYKITVGDT